MKILTIKKTLISSGLVASMLASSISPVFAQTTSQTQNPVEGFWKSLHKDVKDVKNDTTPGPEKRQDKKGVIQDLKDATKMKGAVVTAINGSTLTVSFNGKTYTVNTDRGTIFRKHFFGKSSLSEISVNDKIDVLGKFTDNAKTTIQARFIRDASIMKRHGIFFGTVTSKGSTSFVLQTKNRGSQTITISGTTKFTDQKGDSISYSQLNLNDKVRVEGVWDSVSKQLTEVDRVRDFSIPTTTPTPSPAH